MDLAGATEEKPHFYYAKFLDKLMSDARQRQSTTKVPNRQCANLEQCSFAGSVCNAYQCEQLVQVQMDVSLAHGVHVDGAMYDLTGLTVKSHQTTIVVMFWEH